MTSRAWKAYVAPIGRFKYCERCAGRQPFSERFTPLCARCELRDLERDLRDLDDAIDDLGQRV